MKRRSFLTEATVATAATAATAAVVLAACGDANEDSKRKDGNKNTGAASEVKWKMASSFPKGEGSIYSGAVLFADRLRKITGGRFDIETHPAGDLLPAMDVLDATQQATVQCCHTCSYYFNSKNKAFSLGTSIPFGLNSRQFNAWWLNAGGREIMNEFYATYGVIGFAAGNVGSQMAGWFRKEINTVADLQGLKMRIAGFAVDVATKLGASAVTLPVSDVHAALERGDIDVAEYLGPYADEQLGFHKAAKYYYSPGWQEPNATIHIFVNKTEWDKLPKEFQEAFEAAAGESNVRQQAHFDAKNAEALARLVQAGVQLRALPDDVLKTLYSTSKQLYAEESAQNPAFAKIYQSQEKFQKISNAWLVPTESRVDLFIQQQGN